MKNVIILFAFLFFIRIYCISQQLPPWKEGYLDIHHISTGSGNASLIVFPDRTTLLFDAGEIIHSPENKTPNLFKASPPLPNGSLTAAQTIINYTKQTIPNISDIDFAVISHFHSDHYGSISASSKQSSKGKYKLSGITEIHELLPIRKLIDRNYPSYDYPVGIRQHTFEKESFSNYCDFVNSISQETTVESLLPGSKDQIKLKNNLYPDFTVRNIKSNGVIWSGKNETTINLINEPITLKQYNENPLSIALKISYGKFDYFTGGDMTGQEGPGLTSWFDMETPVAKVVGPVEALTLNHHGVRDATNAFFLKTLQPQVIVQQSWSSNHPGEEVLHRIISPFLYENKRDIFATYIHDETITTYGRWLPDNYKSMHGHILIRVLPKGNEFYVYVLDDTRTDITVTKSFGPYYSK